MRSGNLRLVLVGKEGGVERVGVCLLMGRGV